MRTAPCPVALGRGVLGRDGRLDVIPEGKHEDEVADLGDDRGGPADVDHRQSGLLGKLTGGLEVGGVGQTDENGNLVVVDQTAGDVRDLGQVALAVVNLQGYRPTQNAAGSAQLLRRE